MKEIIELSKRIQNEAPGAVPVDLGGLMVDRVQSGEEGLTALPPAIRLELNQLCARLNAVIPDDFDYCLFLGDDEPSIAIEYNDGPQTIGSCPIDLNPQLSIIDQLKIVDWAKKREQVLPMCQTFEFLKDVAADRPANLPSTLELQVRFKEEMQAFVKSKRVNDGKVHLLMFREDNGYRDDTGLIKESTETLKEVPGVWWTLWQRVIG